MSIPAVHANELVARLDLARAIGRSPSCKFRFVPRGPAG
jgi:hypothetical protein